MPITGIFVAAQKSQGILLTTSAEEFTPER
jgi:hypothetical protein